MNHVNAINQEQINLVHALLNTKFSELYADVWKVGVNSSLRISDLLSIKFTDMDLECRELNLVECKTGKAKSIRLNASVLEIVHKRRKQYPDDIYLFQSKSNRVRNKEPQPINRICVGRAFKQAGEMIGVNISTHSMRKSRGKALFDAGVPIEKIAKVLNHSCTGQTLRYIGIEKEQVLQTYDDFEL